MISDQLASLGPALEGKYQIERPLGTGGMATVYLATDLRHQRPVALKVLRPDLSAVLGADRFLQEIRLTAGLQHPHILALYDSGSVGNTLFYVMPYAEGESLRNRLQQEPQLPIEVALRIATEVAGALEYAHRHGLIHRDIKPENVLFQDGRVLVADFGLALAIQTAGGSRLTESGLALGTPQYMSPEQGAGDRILDARTDIYSLGCVTYEMLAGEPPHQGPTPQAILSRVMTELPRSLSVARPTVSPGVAAVVHRALQRSPADRFATAGEFATALASADATQAGALVSAGGVRQGASRLIRPMRAASVLAAAVTLMIGGAILGPLILKRPEVPPQPISFYLETDSTSQIDERFVSPLRISRDGRRIVYAARTPTGSVLLLRSLGKRESRPIPGTEDASSPALSPDGDSVAFLANGAIRKVPVGGGPVVTLATLASDVALPELFGGLDWGPHGVLVFSADRLHRLFSVSSMGSSPPKPIPTDSSCYYLTEPSLLRGGRVLAECGGDPTTGFSGTSELAVVPLAGGPAKRIGIRGTSPRYAAGFVLYRVQDGTLKAQRFDQRRLTARPIPAAIGRVEEAPGTGGAVYDVSESGALVHVVHGTDLALAIAGPDRHERIVVTDDPDRPGGLAYPRFSPDGTRLVFVKAGGVWVYSLAQRTEQRLVSDLSAAYPIWSPDSRRIVFSSSKDGDVDLWWVRADGLGGEQRLFSRPLIQAQASFTGDGQWLTFVETPNELGGDIVLMPAFPKPHGGEEVFRTPFQETQPAISPDGRWLAYASRETGAFEIYVRPFRREGERQFVSVGGGDGPVWLGKGRSLLYRHDAQILAVDIAPGEQFKVRGRRVLFDRPQDRIQAGNRHYDATADGSTFVFVTRQSERRIAVTVNALPRN